MNRRPPLPIVVTFDLSRPRPRELNRIRGAFERLGWEHLGNTAFRYPPLGAQPQAEDWFNRVGPALMILKASSRFAAPEGRGIVRFTLDAQTSTGFSHEAEVGTPPLSANEIDYSRPSAAGEDFGQQQLEAWLDAIEWPYAPPPHDQAAGP
jgi:hypothetical protein